MTKTVSISCLYLIYPMAPTKGSVLVRWVGEKEGNPHGVPPGFHAQPWYCMLSLPHSLTHSHNYFLFICEKTGSKGLRKWPPASHNTSNCISCQRQHIFWSFTSKLFPRQPAPSLQDCLQKPRGRRNSANVYSPPHFLH